MRYPFLLVLALLVPWIGFGQVPSVTESSSLQSGPNSWRRVLTNQSTSSLVAYMAGCKPKRGTTSLQDALLGVGRSVGTGMSIETEVNGPSTCGVAVRAAIFADGHAEGEPEFIDELFAERRGAYQALGDTIKLLIPIYTEHVPTVEIIGKLEAGRTAMLQKMTHESGGYNSVLIDVSQVLRHPHVLYGFPPESFGEKMQLPSIQDLMTSNGVSEDEARVMILTKRLEAWKSVLENNLQATH